MGLKAIKILSHLLLILIPLKANALTVTSQWQEWESYLFLFIATVIFITLFGFIFRNRVWSPNRPDPRLALLWRHVPDIITEIDCDGVILSVNRPAAGLVEDLIGHSSFEFLTEEGQRVFSTALNEAITQRSPQRYELEINLYEEGITWIDNRIIPIIEDLKIVSLLVITSDITEQKKHIKYC